MTTKAAQRRIEAAREGTLLKNYVIPTKIIGISRVMISTAEVMTKVIDVIAKFNRGDYIYDDVVRSLEAIDVLRMPSAPIPSGDTNIRLAVIPFGDWYIYLDKPVTLCHYRILITE